VRIWRDLLFLIGCVIGSREEHLCLIHVLMVFRYVLNAISRLLLKQHLMCLMWTQMDMWWGWALLELGSGLMVGFCSVLWYLRWTVGCWLGSIRLLVSEMDPLSVHGWRWSESLSSSEPSLADQISTWGRLWSMNSWVMASMMNYLIKNISELFIVLYDHIAIYSKSAWPTFSKADTETDCSSQKLHMFRHGFPLPSLSTGWPGLGGKRIGFAF